MKSTILRTDEVQRLARDGVVTVRRPVKPQPDKVGFGSKCEVHPYCTGTIWPLAYYERRNGVWNSSQPLKCPLGAVGEERWVRETWRSWFPDEYFWRVRYKSDNSEIITKCGWDEGDSYSTPEECGCALEGTAWKSPVTMPRWASRLSLEVVSVRCERLNEITEEDAEKEGIEPLFSDATLKERPDIASIYSGKKMSWTNYLWHGNHGDMGMGNKLSDSWEYQFSGYESAVGSFSSLWEMRYSKKSLGWSVNPFVFVQEVRRVKCRPLK